MIAVIFVNQKLFFSKFEKPFLDDHLEVVIDIDYYACIPITNVLGCPKGYQRHGTQCHKSWRPIGFQNIATGAALTANCRSIGCEIDVDGNFLNLGTQTTFQNRFSNGCLTTIILLIDISVTDT